MNEQGDASSIVQTNELDFEMQILRLNCLISFDRVSARIIYLTNSQFNCLSDACLLFSLETISHNTKACVSITEVSRIVRSTHTRPDR